MKGHKILKKFIKILSFISQAIIISAIVVACKPKKNSIESDLPKEMPEDLSFIVQWNFDGKYDLKTGIIENGYNYDLDVECKTKLILTENEIKEIYKIIRDARIDKVYSKKEIETKNKIVTPAPELRITICYGDYEHKIILNNAISTDNLETYVRCKEEAIAIRKIVNNYIVNKEAYINLP